MSDNRIKKVFVLPDGNSEAVKRVFRDRGYQVAEGPNDKFDAAVFNGGTDICPYLYGEKPLVSTQHWMVDRDLKEVAFLKSLDIWQPKIGICRGAQLLCVQAGGKLVQHVDNHTNDHEVIFDGFRREDPEKTLTINSTHHQLMVPANDSYQLIAYAKKSTVRKTAEKIINIDRDADTGEEYLDPEIIHCWMNNALCFQAHPEYTSKVTTDLFFECVEWLGTTSHSSAAKT